MLSNLRERFKYFFNDVIYEWQLGVSKAPIQFFLIQPEMPAITWIVSPRETLWADPFGLIRDGKYYIFYEEYIKKNKYATLNCMILDEQLRTLDNKLIIDEGYHMSYPYLIQYQGADYMLPESSASDTLILYKCDSFPFKWHKEKVLLHVPCIDTVLFFKDDYWWLIYCKEKGKIEDRDRIAYLRRNKEFMEGWEDCAEIEIAHDLLNARGGGSVFEYEGELYRVTQNCTIDYGQSMVINKITNLSENDFKEEAVKKLKIDSPLVTNFHTLSSLGSYALVDRRVEVLYPKSIGSILSRFTGKLKGK